MRVLVVAIYDMGEEGENCDGGMDEEEEEGENESMTWKGSEREVCWAWCVCALLCCVASGSTEDRGTGGVGSEGQKSTLYTGKYKNLSPLNAANTRGKYQKGF